MNEDQQNSNIFPSENRQQNISVTFFGGVQAAHVSVKTTDRGGGWCVQKGEGRMFLFIGRDIVELI